MTSEILNTSTVVFNEVKTGKVPLKRLKAKIVGLKVPTVVEQAFLKPLQLMFALSEIAMQTVRKTVWLAEFENEWI